MKKYFVSIMMIAAFVYSAQAAVKIKNSTANRYEDKAGVYAEEAEDADAIATLENDIRILDEEIAKCKKQKKGWIAATVIGAAGVVATGTAAAVQGAKISEKKGDLKEKEAELKDKKTELKNVKKQINDESNGESK